MDLIVALNSLWCSAIASEVYVSIFWEKRKPGAKELCAVTFVFALCLCKTRVAHPVEKNRVKKKKRKERKEERDQKKRKEEKRLDLFISLFYIWSFYANFFVSRIKSLVRFNTGTFSQNFYPSSGTFELSHLLIFKIHANNHGHWVTQALAFSPFSLY